MDWNHVNMRRLVAVPVAIVAAVACAASVTPGEAFADEVRDEQWHIEALGVDKAHKLSKGEGVTIGLIDSGVDADHEDLKGNIKAGKDFGTEGNGLKDERGHGTWTSSLLAGHGHGDNNSEGIMGIAPNATIISVGIGVGDKEGDVAEAIEWLVDKEVDIISVSMHSDSEYDAVDYATQKGIPVVASAGNRTLDPFIGEVVNTYMSWPAYAPGAIPVTATTKDQTFWDGSVDLTDASPQPKLGISAPGKDVMGAKKGGGSAAHDGTSAAAPIVAGTLALIKSAYPELTYNQWVDRLLDTANDKGSDGFDDKFGSGIVNPYRALTEETTFNTHDGKKQVSSPADRLPLEEQGKSSSASGKDDDAQPDSATDQLKPASSHNLVLSIGIFGTAFVLVIAAVVVGVVAVRRRRRSSNF